MGIHSFVSQGGGNAQHHYGPITETPWGVYLSRP